MTDTEINIAIAEACGAVEISPFNPPMAYWPATWKSFFEKQRCSLSRSDEKPGMWMAPVPYFHEDLNAMHEVEKTLIQDPGQYSRFVTLLSGSNADFVNRALVCVAVHATARQRSETFLRVLGKWKE